MDVITRELLRGTNQTRFTADDLSDMGKQASRDYLCGISSMNESIVKIAREKPGITAHHLQRVVEFANNETFQRIFEKQAGDKNIEFEVADPREVLRALDVEARPAAEVVSFDYGTDPTKLAADTRALEADLMLAEQFGVHLSTPAMDKAAGADDTYYCPTCGWRGKGSSLVNGKCPKCGKSVQLVKKAAAAMSDGEGKTPTEQDKASIREWIAKHDKAKDEDFHAFVEGMGLNVHKAEGVVYEMANELAKKAEAGKSTSDIVSGGRADRASASDYPSAQISKGIKVEKEHTNNPELAKQIAMDHLEEFPDYYTRLDKMEEEAKKAIKKEAMRLIKMGGPGSDLALQDMTKAASLENIKRAARGEGYAEENPHGELVRMRQTLAKTAEDLSLAYARNQGLLREAMGKLAFEVKQYMLSGGGLGEVVDAMGTVDDGQRVKEAMSHIVPELQKHGLNTTQARVDAIYYEMTKNAHRVVNPDNPIVESFAALVKLADGQEKLHESVNTANELLKKADAQLARVARHS